MPRRSSFYNPRLLEAPNARSTLVSNAPLGSDRMLERRRFLQGLAVFGGAAVGGLMFANHVSRNSSNLANGPSDLTELGFTHQSNDPADLTQEAVRVALEAVEYNDALSDAPDGDMPLFEETRQSVAVDAGALPPLQRPASQASEAPDMQLVPYPSLRLAQPSYAGPSPIPGTQTTPRPEIDEGTEVASARGLSQVTGVSTNTQVRPGTTPSRTLARYLTNERRTLNIYNINTGERGAISYANRGRYDSAGLDDLDYLFRDRRRNEVAKMDAYLYDQLWVMQTLTGAREVGLISGYRSPATNAALRAQSSGVARNSYHVRRQAADIRMSGVSLSAMRNAAVQLGNGGVGYYSRSNFLHIDTGPIRSWGA